MGYADKLQKLCVLRGLDQAALASKVGLSKSSISRILSGAQEPKLRLAYDLAKALGVTLDYLVDDSLDLKATDHLVMVSEDELTVLKIVRRLGVNVAIDRLLGIEPKGESPQVGGQAQAEAPRADAPKDQDFGGATHAGAPQT